ncbi:MAG: lytic transglycosylase domain-containing protein [Desulfuromonadales bacterium]|nr:lytic transglycosylase domain-containing protein [Desulfuromonadales bacterium]
MPFNVIKLFSVALLTLVLLCDSAYPFCFQEAGQKYGINPMVLRSIAKVESNNDPGAINKNSNGSYDLGLMQINSIWKPLLGEERWNHLGDACYNTKTGAWILAMCINKYGYNWKAIGCYNSQTPEKSEVYAKKVFSQLKQLELRKEPQPLDSDVEAALLNQIDELVESARQGKKTGKKKVLKFVPYVRLSPRQLREPPPLPAEEPDRPDSAVGRATTETMANKHIHIDRQQPPPEELHSP